jgi:hypothetical protein
MTEDQIEREALLQFMAFTLEEQNNLNGTEFRTNEVLEEWKKLVREEIT